MSSEQFPSSPRREFEGESVVEAPAEAWVLHAEQKATSILSQLRLLAEQGSESSDILVFVTAEHVSPYGKKEVFAEGTMLPEKLMAGLVRGLSMPRAGRSLLSVMTREGRPFYPFANHHMLPYTVRVGRSMEDSRLCGE